ncbi:aminopeptidase P N-terminal domain-containing protein [Frateuria aurantia]
MAEHGRRRRQLMQMLDEDAVVLLAAAPRRVRSGDICWPYRQDSDFLYLTGYQQPDAVLALLPGRRHGETVLFCRERDPELERWHGPGIGTEGAVSEYLVDDAFPIEDIDDILPGMIEGRSRIYCHFGSDQEFDGQVQAWIRRLRQLQGGGVVAKELLALGHLLHDLRLFKSRGELQHIREAVAIACEGHRAAMMAARVGVHEYQVEAAFTHAIRMCGAQPAFVPVVAAGPHACILHYQAGAGRLADGDLLLVDAGAEVAGYASDLCRSYPVNGRFSEAQRQLYEIVLAAQQAAIEQVRPGQVFEAAHQSAVAVLTEGLCRLGLLSGEPALRLAEQAYRRFFPAKTCHWLGLDVHDVGDYRVAGSSRVLEPGMVLTVEPGLYVPADAVDLDARWRGIGVRVEDMVAVTRDGAELLSAALPRSVEAIEALLAHR